MDASSLIRKSISLVEVEIEIEFLIKEIHVTGLKAAILRIHTTKFSTEHLKPNLNQMERIPLFVRSSNIGLSKGNERIFVVKSDPLLHANTTNGCKFSHQYSLYSLARRRKPAKTKKIKWSQLPEGLNITNCNAYERFFSLSSGMLRQWSELGTRQNEKREEDECSLQVRSAAEVQNRLPRTHVLCR